MTVGDIISGARRAAPTGSTESESDLRKGKETTMNSSTNRGYLIAYQHDLSVKYLQEALKELAKSWNNRETATAFFYLAHKNLAWKLGAVVQEVFRGEGLCVSRLVSDEEETEAYRSEDYRHRDAWDEAAKAAAEIIGEDAMAAAAGGQATDEDPIPF